LKFPPVSLHYGSGKNKPVCDIKLMKYPGN